MHVTPSVKEIQTVILRGARKQCPDCGKGKIFNGWNILIARCPFCGCEIRRREGECWAFMYFSTAFLTGIIIVGMFMVHPPSILIGQIFVGCVAIGLILFTIPIRKGIAISIDYLIEGNAPRASKK